MFSKIIFALLVAYAAASGYRPAGYAQPSYDIQQNIDYNFNYDVKDDYTYNQQSRQESKNGNYVVGSYSLLQPDGRVRLVKYTADDYGFQAVVDNNGGYSAPSYSAPAYSAPAYRAPAPAYRAPAPAYRAPAYNRGPY